MKQTHIFICSYNRLIPLQQLVSSLLTRGYNNIVILDNQSTYEPLLDWYKTLEGTNVTVYQCKHNYGPGALDRCRFEEDEFRSRYLHIVENVYGMGESTITLLNLLYAGVESESVIPFSDKQFNRGMKMFYELENPTIRQLKSYTDTWKNKKVGFMFIIQYAHYSEYV